MLRWLSDALFGKPVPVTQNRREEVLERQMKVEETQRRIRAEVATWIPPLDR